MVYDVINAKIDRLVIHVIESYQKQSEDSDETVGDGLGGVRYSKREVSIENDGLLAGFLLHYFFDSFREPTLYSFDTDTDILQDNKVFSIAESIFEDESTFYENSRLLADALSKNSTNTHIKSSDFYVVLFKDMRVMEEEVSCIGLFKSEHKDTFLKVFNNNDSDYTVEYEEGVDLKKLDKGCLIFNIEKENGYIVALLDKDGRGEAAYWKHGFLNLKDRQDNNFLTSQFMNLCKTFVQERFNPQNNVERPDQIDMLNRQVEFFKDNEVFDIHKFKEDVLANNEDICEEFDAHKREYEERNNCELDDTFKISDDVVRKSKSKFKSVIKLDKNFHIYIHGNRDLVERAFDPEKKMFYYKLYFEDEA